MPDKNIFCNAPWYELHIYWDGSLGFCCQESHKLYPTVDDKKFNIKNTSISEWYNSYPMRQARLAMHDVIPVSFCRRCQSEEKYSGTSRRHRCNQKSIIFTQGNFDESYQQSPGWEKFEHSLQNQGAYNGMPVDLHIDLGNYCNLTCKMCNPQASSSIASQQVKWGIEDAKQYIGSDWTRDESTWNRVLLEIASIEKLNNVHFMGGETLITKRFEDFIDYMIDCKKFNLNFSFVTNGTTFNETLLNKLKKFQRIGIEVSIESLTEHNAYQRQGTDTAQVLENIKKYLEHCNNTNITLKLRPAISCLTIGTYYTLLEFAMKNKLLVQSLVVDVPAFFDPTILPATVKQAYLEQYHELRKKLNPLNGQYQDLNNSDPNNYQLVILNQVDQCINILSSPAPDNANQLLNDLVAHCRRWDVVHDYNALELYPELAKEFKQRGY